MWKLEYLGNEAEPESHASKQFLKTLANSLFLYGLTWRELDGVLLGRDEFGVRVKIQYEGE